MRTFKEKKTKEIKLSLTPRDYLKLKAVASLNNESVQSFIRRNVIL
jgi:hypothetical protein